MLLRCLEHSIATAQRRGLKEVKKITKYAVSQAKEMNVSRKRHNVFKEACDECRPMLSSFDITEDFIKN